MTIDQIQQEIVEEFSGFEDWMDKYAYLIEIGNEMAPIDPKYKIESNLIRGCQSRVWLHQDLIDGKIKFEAESDALIVKGLVALLLRVYSGRTPKEILESEPRFIDEIGLRQHLSPTRSNGLLAMVKQMKLYALAYEKISANKN
jgi:cysteine desulfuration protein SufE